MQDKEWFQRYNKIFGNNKRYNSSRKCNNPKWYITHKRASSYMKEKLTELKLESDKSTIIGGDFNTPLPVIDRTSRQKISKHIGDFNNTII